MSIIIQAGHKSSKSRQLMEKLYERGLSRPADSYTYKMTSEQVSETLCKVLSLEDMSSANDKMADNIMIDLLLANLDSENWGWESDRNLASLEYWGQIEPNVKFILVFDHPKNVLRSLENKKITIDLIDQEICEWVNYHQNILEFFEKNKNTAILIEGVSALNDINGLAVQVKNIAQTLQFKSGWQVISEPSIFTEDSKNRLQSNVVKDNLFIEVINKYPEAIKIFNSLIDKASIKNSSLIYKTKRMSLDSLVESLNYLELEKEKIHLESDRDKNYSLAIIKNKKQEVQKLDRELQELKSKNKYLENSIKKNQELDKDLEKKAPNVKDRLDVNKLKEPVHYGAEDRIKNDLPYRLGSTIVKSGINPQKLIKLPLNLVKEYQEFQKTNKIYDNLPPIEKYQDFYKVEKVKSHLSYRLGKIVVDNTKSPKNALKMPIKIGTETISHFRRKKGLQPAIERINNEKKNTIGIKERKRKVDNDFLPLSIIKGDRVSKGTIVLATVDFLPNIGGISIMTHELANNMVEDGFNVIVVAKSGSYVPNGFLRKYSLFVDKDFKKEAKSGKLAVEEDKRISVMFQRIIKRFNVNCILLLHPFYYGIGAKDAAIKARIPFSVYFHGYEIRSQLLGKYPRNLKQLINEKVVYSLRERTIYTAATADYIFVNSNFTKSVFDDFTIKPEVIVTGCGISNEIVNKFPSVSTIQFESNKQKHRTGLVENNEVLIGFIGRLVTQKNVTSILKLIKENERFRCIIIGTGPDADSLRYQVEDFGILDRVDFVGVVSEEEKWKILQALDFIALMSRVDDTTGHVEGFGIALLEGIVAGAVPLSSGTGGMVDIIDDDINGLICPIGDEKTQSKRIIKVYDDKETYDLMRQNAQNKLKEKFTWNAAAKKITDRLL